MPTSVEAYINPLLLGWARQAAGYTIQAASTKMKVRQEVLEGWERGERHPTLAKLRSLASTYKFPSAIFYLPIPPPTPRVPRDFRRPIRNEGRPLSPASILEIRKAKKRQGIAKEVASMLGIELPRFNVVASVSDEPDLIAKRIRTAIGPELAQQTSWRGYYDALAHWKKLIEEQSILVSSMDRVPSNELSAFSVYDNEFPAIALNPKDNTRRRLFSLLHEVAHITLHGDGLCNPGDEAPEDIEVFCNRVAGASLVPRDMLLAMPSVESHESRTDWPDDVLGALAASFGVSREVVLIRLVHLGRASQAFYQRWKNSRPLWVRDGGLPEQEEDAPFIRKYARTVIAHNGEKYTTLVLSGYLQGKLTNSDVSQSLGIKVRHIVKVKAELYGASDRRGRE